ncbi:MAG TPA: hypothetical protein VEF04_13355, partial [Blastocatellia bacterium]|nr:hypothetical protein [Blastocatellia bacterium]
MTSQTHFRVFLRAGLCLWLLALFMLLLLLMQSSYAQSSAASTLQIKSAIESDVPKPGLIKGR